MMYLRRFCGQWVKRGTFAPVRKHRACADSRRGAGWCKASTRLDDAYARLFPAYGRGARENSLLRIANSEMPWLTRWWGTKSSTESVWPLMGAGRRPPY
jgi:hypothetical protein